jgi:hypothetical protein
MSVCTGEVLVVVVVVVVVVEVDGESPERVAAPLHPAAAAAKARVAAREMCLVFVITPLFLVSVSNIF